MQVVVLAGPSGSGKSRLAERTGLPVLRLDDFYKDHDDGSLPQREYGVDWDDPASWCHDEAVAAIETLCRTGRVDVPVYDIPTSARTGTHTLDLEGHSLFVAEGIFAQEVVPDCAERGLVAAAFCLRQHQVLTFWRRLTRDLREHRKPPVVLVRRGITLLRAQREIVAHAVARGCRTVTPEEALREIVALRESATR